jgi:hypothetical protein
MSWLIKSTLVPILVLLDYVNGNLAPNMKGKKMFHFFQMATLKEALTQTSLFLHDCCWLSMPQISNPWCCLLLSRFNFQPTWCPNVRKYYKPQLVILLLIFCCCSGAKTHHVSDQIWLEPNKHAASCIGDIIIKLVVHHILALFSRLLLTTSMTDQPNFAQSVRCQPQ